MKKTWEAPALETLNVKMTMASTVYGEFTDEAYVPGNPADPSNPSTWQRFES